MDIVFQYPPELFQLLVDTIPLLCPSKRDLLTFFQGAGVPRKMLADLEAKLRADRDSVNKYEITRVILTRLNERGEASLRERREILNRVVRFEDFSTCWPDAQLKAKGLVAEIRRVIDVKDSFTRMNLEREQERLKRVEAARAAEQDARLKRETLRKIQADLLALVSDSNPHRRGKALEGVLNRLFKENGILVSEAFVLKDSEEGGVIEQIDGAILFEGHHYLVEVKWRKDALGVPEVSQHVSRVLFRGDARGFMISVSGYTAPAISTCREALQRAVILLADLEEIVLLLEQESDLKEWFGRKVSAAVVNRNPFHRPFADQ